MRVAGCTEESSIAGFVLEKVLEEAQTMSTQ